MVSTSINFHMCLDFNEESFEDKEIQTITYKYKH